MDPKFQTSFIPQKPVASSAGSGFTAPKMPQAVNIFNVIAGVVFAIAVMASAGVFVYKQVLNSQIAKESTALAQARTAFDSGTIQNLIDVSSRIMSAGKLLDSHVAMSGLFNLLQSLTVQKVSFTNFSFTKKDGSLTISMDGESAGYDTLAAQANIFAQSPFIKEPTFSSFDLAANGNVIFKFSAMIDPNLISYKQALASLGVGVRESLPATDTGTATSTTP